MIENKENIYKMFPKIDDFPLDYHWAHMKKKASESNTHPERCQSIECSSNLIHMDYIVKSAVVIFHLYL